MSRKTDIAAGMWDVLLYAYNQKNPRNVEVPTDEVIDILCSLAANVIASVKDPNERDRLLRSVPQRMDRLTNIVRLKSSLHVPSTRNLILPN